MKTRRNKDTQEGGCEMDTVLLISEKNNFMVLSLKEQLKERYINVLHTDDEPSEIGKIKCF